MIYITVTHSDKITGLAMLKSVVEFTSQTKAMKFLKQQHKYTVDTSTIETKRDDKGKLIKTPVAKYNTTVTIKES